MISSEGFSSRFVGRLLRAFSITSARTSALAASRSGGHQGVHHSSRAKAHCRVAVGCDRDLVDAIRSASLEKSPILPRRSPTLQVGAKAGLVDPHKLQLESLPAAERLAAEYVPGIRQPSVVTLANMRSRSPRFKTLLPPTLANALNEFITHRLKATTTSDRTFRLSERALQTKLYPARPRCGGANRKKTIYVC